MNNINVMLNFFGPDIKKKDIPRILDTEISDIIIEYKRRMLESFFELPFNALSKEILERYAKVPNLVIVPHTTEILERLLKPLRSAKKCYCFVYYTATISLCGLVRRLRRACET